MPRQAFLCLLLLLCARGARAAGQETAESLTRAAGALWKQGDDTGARRQLDRALELSPNSPAANLLLGNLLLAQERYPEAMDRFETVLALDLRNADARQGEISAATSLALQARRQQHPEAALRCLEHASQMLPDDTTLLTDYGIQALELNRLPAAHDALSRVLVLDQGNLQALYALARVEIAQDRLAPAEQHLRAYLAARPEDATAHYGLGHLLQTQLQTEAAAAEFQRSITLQPVQTESYYQLGEMALEAGRDDEAERYFDQVRRRSGTHGGALTGQGILAYRRKDYATARTFLQRAVEASPAYQPAHYYLGLTLARLGETAASRRELDAATALAREQQGKGQPLAVQQP